jgi:beta-N-acetylhexosaminidase
MVIAISDLAGQQEVYKSLLTAAQRGDFDLEKPIERILDFKTRFAGPNTATQPLNQANIAAATQKSITFLRTEKLATPFVAGKPLLINLALAQPSQVEGQQPSTILGELWRTKFPDLPVMKVSTEPTTVEIDRVLREAYDNPDQLKLVQALLALDQPLLVIAVRGPYDLLSFSKVPNYMVTYSDTPTSVRALVNALTGVATINGKLPVSISGLYEIGAGLQLPGKS